MMAPVTQRPEFAEDNGIKGHVDVVHVMGGIQVQTRNALTI
jgi:hypothetical protein